MKLRIKGDSVRMRITKSDLEALRQTGMVEEHTHFGSHTLCYQLKRSAEHNTLQASFQNNCITVFLPEQHCDTLLHTEQIGYNHTQDNGAAQGLFILIEKDFKCLDATWEDQSDMWDNPNDQCQPTPTT